MTADAGRRCAVLGSPIAHSLSPALHRAAYAELGLGWSYDLVETDEAGLAGFVAGLGPEWRGLSLTMPLKAAALTLGDADALAVQAQAANTLVLEPDGTRRLSNTDVPGLVWALRRAGVTTLDRVTLLGAGATARSTLLSVALLGATEVTVAARTPARAAPLVALGRDLGVVVTLAPWGSRLPPADAVLSTVVAGAADGLAAEAVASAPVVFDAIYHPWPTPLAAAAEGSGGTVVSGLDLLVGQALLQIEAMTGCSVGPELLYEAGRAALAARAEAAEQARPTGGPVED